MPPNPKRPFNALGPFDDEQVLHADDPRPQRVAQYPASETMRTPHARRAPNDLLADLSNDEEMQAQYNVTTGVTVAAFLYVERGPGQGQLLQVAEGAVVIGRSSVSDLRLQHPSISRRHAQIRRSGERFFVKDLGSQNGTFVNGRRIDTEVEIRMGSALSLGNALVQLRGPVSKPQRPNHPPVANSITKTGPIADIAQTQRQPVQKRVEEKDEEAPARSNVALLVGVGLLCLLVAGGLGYFFLQSPEVPAPRPKEAAKPKSATPEVETTVLGDADKKKQIDEAIAKKMAASAETVEVESEAPAV
jgi:pSer/pThr/pTyr-binding forkhead associated (FHA) protein